MVLYILIGLVIILLNLVLKTLHDILKANEVANDALLQGFNELLQRLHPIKEGVSDINELVRASSTLNERDLPESIGRAVRDELGYFARPNEVGKTMRDQMNRIESALKDIS